jgi:peptide/nickel transport system substrate-binding protein
MPRTGPIPSASFRSAITAAVLVGLLAAACGPSASPTPEARRGGTLRVALTPNGAEAEGLPYYDPADFFALSALNRVLVRTLVSYNGLAPEDGGTELHPDLAQELPAVSADGLSWTFHLKSGITYGPPLADREIRAEDFITAFEYSVRRYGPQIFIDVVGVEDYAAGEVDTIAGLEAPDATTLVVHLTARSSDLGNRLASAAAGPIPAEALSGHEDEGYAGYLVSTGPYMYEAAVGLDLSDPDAAPYWSRDDGGPVVLVRNPSWSAASDPLRGAYVDRIEATLTAGPGAAAALVEAGAADLMDGPAPFGVVQRWLADSDRADRVYSHAGARVQYVAFNLAQPPFDDVHVRRAVNFVIDRAAAAAALEVEREATFIPAGHAIPDALLNGLLVGYAPYGSSGDTGNLVAAQEEMRASRYDGDGDGSCDAAACESVAAAFVTGGQLQAGVTDDLAAIGILLTPTDADAFDPTTHVAATVGIGWGVDFPVASNFGPLWRRGGLEGPGSGHANLSLMGESPDDLDRWGYGAQSVPSLDVFIDRCFAAVGTPAFECWAGVDQLVMERAVAWAPLGFSADAWILSERVAAFAPDANLVAPAIDRIQLSEEP